MRERFGSKEPIFFAALREPTDNMEESGCFEINFFLWIVTA